MDDFEVHLDMEGQCICETVNQKNPMISETERWQKYVFLPKFVKWYRSQFSEDSNSTTQKTIRSLSLIDISGYNDLYKHLKQKYAPQVLKVLTRDYFPTLLLNLKIFLFVPLPLSSCI